MPYTGGSQSASIGRSYCGCLKTLVYALLIYLLKTYTSAFENVGIGTAYASAFKSVGIYLEWIKFKRPMSTFSKVLV